MNIADEIRKLHELHQAGALTEEEFAQAKAAILATNSSSLHLEQDGAQTPLATGVTGERKNNPMATAGFICGLCSMPLYWIGIFPILAIVFSVIGLVTFDNKR